MLDNQHQLYYETSYLWNQFRVSFLIPQIICPWIPRPGYVFSKQIVGEESEAAVFLRVGSSHPLSGLPGYARPTCHNFSWPGLSQTNTNQYMFNLFDWLLFQTCCSIFETMEWNSQEMIMNIFFFKLWQPRKRQLVQRLKKINRSDV